MSTDITEVLPHIVPDTATLYLSLHSYGDSNDGPVWAMVHQDERSARNALLNDKSSRYAGIVRLPISRALLAERWGR